MTTDAEMLFRAHYDSMLFFTSEKRVMNAQKHCTAEKETVFSKGTSQTNSDAKVASLLACRGVVSSSNVISPVFQECSNAKREKPGG